MGFKLQAAGLFLLLTVVPLAPTALASNNQPAAKAVKYDHTLVAKVNNQPIYADQLDLRVNALLSQSSNQHTSDYQKSVRKEVLNEIVQEELLYQASQKLKIPELDKQVEREFATLKTGNPNAAFWKVKSESEIRQAIKRQITIKEYIKRNGLNDPVIPEAEIKAFYEESKQNFIRNEAVKVRHVLIGVAEDASAEQRKEAQQKIEQARQAILAGKPFAEVAKEYSTCNSAPKGGELGLVERGYMPKEFETVAFSLEKGALSPVVQTSFGYHVLEVLDHQAAGVASYQEMKEFLGDFLKQDLAPKKMAAHLQKLREQAKIESFLQ